MYEPGTRASCNKYKITYNNILYYTIILIIHRMIYYTRVMKNKILYNKNSILVI